MQVSAVFTVTALVCDTACVQGQSHACTRTRAGTDTHSYFKRYRHTIPCNHWAKSRDCCVSSTSISLSKVRSCCVSTLHPCSLPQLLLFAGPAVARKLKTGPVPSVEMCGNWEAACTPTGPHCRRKACLVSHYSWRPMIYKRVLLEPGLSIKVSPPFYRSDQDILHVDKATSVSQLRESWTRTKCD